ncbi:MAG: hypothetical protein HYT93_01185 [Parcubacteria group bacterium]|nr:hypothetical protein [Parcubacteria group bacterium]
MIESNPSALHPLKSRDSWRLFWIGFAGGIMLTPFILLFGASWIVIELLESLLVFIQLISAIL